MNDSILVKDTTREECWLGGGSVEGIYAEYIEGKKELAEVNAEYSSQFAGKQRG